MLPTPTEQKRLTKKGLGSPKMTRRFCSLKKSWSISEVEDYLLSLYPGVRLDMSGFYLARSTKSKKLKRLEFQSVAALKKTVNRGRLFIVPRTQLLHDEEEEREPAVTADSEAADETREETSQERDPGVRTDSAGETSEDVQVLPSPLTRGPRGRTGRRNLSRRPRTAATDSAGETSEDVQVLPSPLTRGPRGGTGRRNLSRRPRTAATVARRQIRQWCNRDTPLLNSDMQHVTDETNTEVAVPPAVDNMGMSVSQVREQQDAEYAVSLHTDQQREREAVRERRTREEVATLAAEIQQMRARRRSRLQPEPNDGITFKFMISNGRTEERRFMRDDSTEVLKNFIGSLEDSTEHFDIQPPDGPILNLSSERTISDIGLSNRTLLHVKWLTEEEYLEKHAEDSEIVASIVPDHSTEDVYQEIDTSTILFGRRPQRDAAAIARLAVSEWVDTISGISASRPSSTPARPDSLPIPEALPEIVIADDTFAAELDLAHSAVAMDTEFERQSATESLQSALKSLADNVLGDVDDGRLKIVVRRDSALTDAIRNISMAQTRLLQPLTVRMIGEPAVDDGGPSRELSSLVVTQLGSPYVDGIEHNKMFSNDFKLYSTNKYQYLGQLTAVLILQGGQGLPVFSHSVTEYLLSGKITNTDVDLPESIRSAFKQLQDLTDLELHNRVDELFPGRFEEGYNVPSTQITRDNLPEMVQAMVAYHVIQPQKMALDQFSKGLQIGGVLQMLQEHGLEARRLFKGAEPALTMDLMESLVEFSYANVEEGSNSMKIAKGIEQGWVLLLQAAESREAEFTFEKKVNIDLSDILKWLSGASRIPAVGFNKNIEICFEKEAILPRVNTCSLCAYFPLLSQFESAEDFMRQLVEWIIDSEGFGLV